MAEIELTQGKVALVDDADSEWLSQWSWCAQRKPGGKWYAVRNAGPRNQRVRIDMHRLIAGAPVGMDVHHDNDNGLDNQRKNLVVCTRAEHMQLDQRCAKQVNRGGYSMTTSAWLSHWDGELAARYRLALTKWRLTRDMACVERVRAMLVELGAMRTERERSRWVLGTEEVA